MAVWDWLLVVAALLLLVLVYGVALVVRRRLLSRHGGTFELSHRVRATRPGRGWVLGLGRYSGSQLEWFRIFSLSPRPARRWDRSELSYVGSRVPQGAEAHAIYPDHLVVECSTRSGTVQLAMSAPSLTGLQAWLESGPPGTDWTR